MGEASILKLAFANNPLLVCNLIKIGSYAADTLEEWKHILLRNYVVKMVKYSRIPNIMCMAIWLYLV